jgi:hypothetical protein
MSDIVKNLLIIIANPYSKKAYKDLKIAFEQKQMIIESQAIEVLISQKFPENDKHTNNY